MRVVGGCWTVRRGGGCGRGGHRGAVGSERGVAHGVVRRRRLGLAPFDRALERRRYATIEVGPFVIVPALAGGVGEAVVDEDGAVAAVREGRAPQQRRQATGVPHPLRHPEDPDRRRVDAQEPAVRPEVLLELPAIELLAEEREDVLGVRAPHELEQALVPERPDPLEEDRAMPRDGLQERPGQVQVERDAVPQVQREDAGERIEQLGDPLAVIVSVGDEELIRVLHERQADRRGGGQGIVRRTIPRSSAAGTARVCGGAAHAKISPAAARSASPRNAGAISGRRVRSTQSS